VSMASCDCVIKAGFGSLHSNFNFNLLQQDLFSYYHEHVCLASCDLNSKHNGIVSLTDAEPMADKLSHTNTVDSSH
jgi:hypothetical protein